MPRLASNCRLLTWVAIGVATLLLTAWLALPAVADQVVLKDGRRLEGRMANMAGMAVGASEKAQKDAVPSEHILMVDDDLRRIYIAKRQVVQFLSPPPEQVERFQLPHQQVIHSRDRFGAVGQILAITPFDKFGRRALTMRGINGGNNINVTQGITTLTPQWTKVEAIGTQLPRVQWEQRIATSGIPLDQLDAILAHMVDQLPAKEQANLGLRVVRFYLQAELVKQAEDRLKKLVTDFPDQAADFQPMLVRARQLYAQRILGEIRTRGDAGQHALAQNLLDKFPTESVAGEVLQGVAKMQEDYKAQRDRAVKLLKQFDDDLAKLTDSKYRPFLKAIREELGEELSFNTLNRLAALEQFLDDESLAADDRLALAASGWLIGAAEASRKLPQAASLHQVRALVRQYLAEPIQANRIPIAAAIKGQEGGTPSLVSKLIANMKPPLDPGPPVDQEKEPGLYKIDVETTPGQPAGSYLVQLPPEYDPLRLYPTIVTLHGGGSSPTQQIDWWAGIRTPDGMRLGQATRNGYIVIAPLWAQPHQGDYEYSAREHGIVLNSLRDACRRFAIDTDRVFLSGHSMGGDAAWDIGISHPDLWAGVIPITAVGDRYVLHYPEHAGLVPMYFVGGELDGDRGGRNVVHFDRYFVRGFNITLVEFQGRGHEHFSDEILRLFDWMGRYRRQMPRKDFAVRTMREFDNRFWWLQLAKLPEKSLVAPETWPPPRGAIAASTTARVTATNGVQVTSGAANVTVFLSPEMVDLTSPVSLTVNGARLNTKGGFVTPDVAVLLDDVIARADRLHPYWVKVEMPGGKINLAGR